MATDNPGNRRERKHVEVPGGGSDPIVPLAHGSPSKDIAKVETVFKDGVGYDPARLVEAARGSVGIR